MRRAHLIVLIAVLTLIAHARAQPSRHFQFTANTGSNATIAIPVAAHPGISGAPLVAGDEIGVFTPSGLCVGAVIWLETDAVLSVWGDNSLTQAIDGMGPNEQMFFRVWSAARTTEYSRVRVSYATGDSLYASNGIYVLSQLTAEAPPDAPSLVFPSNGATGTLTVLTPLWNSAGRATTFRLQIAADSSFAQLVVDATSLSGTAQTVGPLQRNTRYYWRVRGENAAGLSVWSNTWSFTTSALLTPVHFSFRSGTGSNCTIALPTSSNPKIADRPLSPGDEVGVVSPSGFCVGAIVWEGNNEAVTVWGDDVQTEVIDGLRPGELMTIQVWRKLTNTEYRNVTVTYASGTGSFTPDGIAVFASLIAHPVFNIALSDSSVEFGDLAPGQMRQDTVRLTNAGSSTDTLLVAFGGLESPFAITSPANSVALAPAQSAAVILRFAPTQQTPQMFGTFRDTLTMVMNGGTQGVVRLPLSGSVPVSRMTISSTAVVFGDIAVGDSAVSSFWIGSTSISPVTLSSLVTSSPVFSVRLSLPVSIPRGDSLQVPVVFKPRQFGGIRDTLVILSDGGTARIPLSGQSPWPAIILSQNSFDFGEKEINKATVLQGWLTNTSINGLVIDSLVVRSRKFRVDTVLSVVHRFDTLIVRVSFTPLQYGIYKDTLAIYHNGPAGITIVPLQGNCPLPLFEVNRTPLEFGERAVGDSTVMRSVIRNPSLNALALTQVTTSGNFFHVVGGAPVSVPAHDSAQVVVSFKPTVYGSRFSDSLWIVSEVASAAIPLGGASPAPAVTSQPASVDFGQVRRDSTARQNIRLTNTSVNAALIDSFYCITPHFRAALLVGSPRIGRGDTATFVVVFMPDSVRRFVDTLFVVVHGLVSQQFIPLSGAGISTTVVAGGGGDLPHEFALLQNFPNPFNPATVIGYRLPVASFVRLCVYDLLGRELAVLVNEQKEAGEYGITWDGSSRASGMYVCRIEARSGSDPSRQFVQSKKMILLR